MKNEHDPGIRPYDYFYGVLGGKWKPYILRGLFFKEKIRFNETRRILGVSEKMLLQQLRELERDGIITREVFPEVPPRVEYSLTPAGEELRPIFDLIYRWSLARLRERDIEVAPLSFRYHEES
ncbi:MAG: winged helix-turn-helix transcriptional regulator [Clostridiales Family XIII bacterium]|jgi:DNA-binding HxlR family transcriptional regulator|nr:winged helix-turn-helix transcriptional regulator [Clostridiales Family XIII bacterium]